MSNDLHKARGEGGVKRVSSTASTYEAQQLTEKEK